MKDHSYRTETSLSKKNGKLIAGTTAADIAQWRHSMPMLGTTPGSSPGAGMTEG
jgi:hypothetical protein